jgi:glycosyltransferase involved in cell wall biosynthesis
MTIIIPVIALSAHGGTGVLVEFANHAARRGHKVRIIYPRGKISSRHSFEPGVELVPLPISTGSKHLDYLLFLLVCPWYFRGGLVVANFFVTYYPVRIARALFGIEHIYFVQDIESVYTRWVGKLLNFACEQTYKDRRIVTANSFLAGQIRQRGTAPFGSICIGASQRFHATEIPRKAKAYDVICFPRHEPRKGGKRLERVLQLYRESHGPISVLAVSQDDAMLGRFMALGCVSCKPSGEQELVAAFDGARIILFTSYHDGFGLPPLEGMTRGLPAVVYKCGGPSLYLRSGENGFEISDGDDEGAVKAIRSLLSDETCYARMSAAALATGRQFSLTKAIDELLGYAVSAAGTDSTS